jgi:hypothetical protein
LDDFVLLVAKCISDFSHFVISEHDCSVNVHTDAKTRLIVVLVLKAQLAHGVTVYPYTLVASSFTGLTTRSVS